jgi:hypothetical protein
MLVHINHKCNPHTQIDRPVYNIKPQICTFKQIGLPLYKLSLAASTKGHHWLLACQSH